MADYSHRYGELREVEVDKGYLTFLCRNCKQTFDEECLEPDKEFHRQLNINKPITHRCSRTNFGVADLIGSRITGRTKVQRRVGDY